MEITHLPKEFSAIASDSRSQHTNRQHALERLVEKFEIPRVEQHLIFRLWPPPTPPVHSNRRDGSSINHELRAVNRTCTG
ncbi:MAG: hypothetical protein IAE97_09465 [Chthoniobacterales bacterium]|nr:hypothetical protein [Chthoniobacterales bacterium]